MGYKNINIPDKGKKITYKNGEIIVPNNPIIPYIEGDCIGVDITPPMISVVDEAVKIAYSNKRSRPLWFLFTASADAGVALKHKMLLLQWDDTTKTEFIYKTSSGPEMVPGFTTTSTYSYVIGL